MTKKSVWETLSAINVNDHTEKKNGLTYLSWAWAWGVLKTHYPTAQFQKHINESGLPYFKDENGYTYVGVSITVEDQTHTEVFPVLDYRNKAIQNPDSFAVNTALQRALAKAISYHGLGHYIYAGEDIPQADGESRQEPAEKPKASAPQKKPKAAQTAAQTATPPIEDAEGNQHQTDGWAKLADVFGAVVQNFCQDEEQLKNVWARNNKTINTLKDNSPELYEKVVASFKERKTQIQGEAA